MNFGDIITADHVVANNTIDEGLNGESFASIMLDRAARWIEAYPATSKSEQEVSTAFKDLVGAGRKPKLVYTDGAPELRSSRRSLGWLH